MDVILRILFFISSNIEIDFCGSTTPVKNVYHRQGTFNNKAS